MGRKQIKALVGGTVEYSPSELHFCWKWINWDGKCPLWPWISLLLQVLTRSQVNAHGAIFSTIGTLSNKNGMNIWVEKKMCRYLPSSLTLCQSFQDGSLQGELGMGLIDSIPQDKEGSLSPWAELGSVEQCPKWLD